MNITLPNGVVFSTASVAPYNSLNLNRLLCQDWALKHGTTRLMLSDALKALTRRVKAALFIGLKQRRNRTSVLHNCIYKLRECQLQIFPFIFIPSFRTRKVTVTAAVGLEVPHSQHQFLIVLMAPHQDRTKQGQRCSHTTWPDLWAVFSCV